VGGGTAATVDLGSTPLSLTDTAAALNADSGFAAAGLVATASGAKLIITGETDSTGAATINTSTSSMTTTTPPATYAGIVDTTGAIAATTASTDTTAAVNTFTLASASTKLSGTFSYKVGTGSAAQVDLGSTPLSLTDTVAALNADSGFVAAGLHATTSGAQLIVTGSTGASGSADIDTSGSTLMPSLAINTALTAQDAQLTVDGISVDSSSNTVSTAIPGVTFQLLAKSTTPVQVEIVNDNTSIESAFSTFVSSYNTVLTDLTTQEGNDSSGNPEPLYGNPIVAQLQSALSLALTSGTASGSVSSLFQLGISVNNTGELTLDNSTLDSILNSNYSDVVGFMQNTNSFGLNLNTTLSNLGDATPDGSITLLLAANTSQETTLNDNVTAQDALIATQKANVTNELNQANETLQAIPQQLNEMNELYSAMTGYNTNSTG